MIQSLTERFGKKIISLIASLGRFSSYTIKVSFWTTRRPFRIALLFDQLFFVGNKSLFIIGLTGAFSGMVMCYQTYFGFKLINADSFIGPIVAISLAKELAPVFTGLVVAAEQELPWRPVSAL